jgi:hypothetical protein
MTPEEEKAAEIDAMLRAKDAKKDAKKDGLDEGDEPSSINKVLACLQKMSERMDAMETRFSSSDGVLDKSLSHLGDDDPQIRHGRVAEEDEDGADVDPGTGKTVAAPRRDTRNYADALDANRNAVAAFRHRAQPIYNAMGSDAPRTYGDSEGLGSYRRRVLGELKRHSDSYKAVNLETIRDAGAFAAAERTIIADAMAFASQPANFVPTDAWCYPVQKVDPATGARHTEFHSHPSLPPGQKTIFGQMKPESKRVVRFMDSSVELRK